jgi:hypothetical protein
MAGNAVPPQLMAAMAFQAQQARQVFGCYCESTIFIIMTEERLTWQE